MGLIRADLELGVERRVMVMGTSDLDGRLRKLRSKQRLGKLDGNLLKMADRFHGKKLVFSEVCECDGDWGVLAADYRRRLRDEGFKVYGGHISEGYRVMTVSREHKEWVDEGLRALERGVGIGVLVELLRVAQGTTAVLYGDDAKFFKSLGEQEGDL